tara:strand:- start:141 stop:383 length:243 start_codon:yes stop_codon:yes gene_type:complete
MLNGPTQALNQHFAKKWKKHRFSVFSTCIPILTVQTFQNQFFAQPSITEIVRGIRKKMLKKFYEQYFITQHGPEPALFKN